VILPSGKIQKSKEYLKHSGQQARDDGRDNPLGGTTETIDVLMQKLYAGQLDAQIGGPLLSPGAGGVGYLGNLCSLSSERATGQTDWFRTL